MRLHLSERLSKFWTTVAQMRGRTLDLKRRILDRVNARGARPVWTPIDFLDLGPRAAVDKALQRLVALGDLRRVDRGLYDKPTVSSLTGKPNAPDSSAVVDAIGRRDQIRCVVDGLTAANDLGLTTAVPARVTVLADARLRTVHLGKQEIRFKHAAASRLYWARRPAMRVVQALHWLHDVVPSDGPRILDRLRALLADPDHGPAIRDDLRAGLHTLPIWMQSFVRDLIKDVGSGDDQGSPSSRLTTGVRGEQSSPSSSSSSSSLSAASSSSSSSSSS